MTTDFGADDEAAGVAIQGDGKIVAAGCAHCGGGNSVFALARYNTNGSLDPAFDGDGMVITDFGPETSSQAFAVATQEDGKSVAVGA